MGFKTHYAKNKLAGAAGVVKSINDSVMFWL